jgi:intein-encoded DNA endonuclease-like protein
MQQKKMEENSITVLEALEKIGIKLSKNQLSSLGSRMINRHQRFYLEHGKRGGTIVRLYRDTPAFHEEVLKECKELKFCKK